ncbi:hypothetical protein K1719_007846 [Acacia pycnantha]|nr:hypothetical protein K1719_007846 [Acacia pycnantha]
MGFFSIVTTLSYFKGIKRGKLWRVKNNKYPYCGGRTGHANIDQQLIEKCCLKNGDLELRIRARQASWGRGCLRKGFGS